MVYYENECSRNVMMKLFYAKANVQSVKIINNKEGELWEIGCMHSWKKRRKTQKDR